MSMSPPSWDTSSESPSHHTPQSEWAALGDHAAQCASTGGRWGAVRSGAGQVFGFVSSRLVTTGALLAIALTALWLWL
jgi:hypothetical protein